MESPQNINKKSLSQFIETSTAFIQEKIIELIETDEYWLEELGIEDIDLQKTSNIKDLIISKLEDIENYERADVVIQYVLGDYVLVEDDNFGIFHGYCSADSHTRHSALYVFKFNSNFFCYYLPESSLITTDPVPFIEEAIQDEIRMFEIEKENMSENVSEGYFQDFTLDLTWNLGPDFKS